MIKVYLLSKFCICLMYMNKAIFQSTPIERKKIQVLGIKLEIFCKYFFPHAVNFLRN